MAFVDLFGDPAVDFRAGDLFQNGRPLIGRGLEEGGKSPLGKEHRPGEALVIHPRDLFNQFPHGVQLRFQHLPGIRVADFMACRLQFPVGPPSGAVLVPGAAVASLLRLEMDLGKAFPCLARHDLVGALGNLVQAGRPAVEPEADGVQERRFSRACGAGDGEETVGAVGRMGKIDLPVAGERIQVFETYAQYFHP
ncbi:MAG: hypothetical protein A4E72_01920 [Syntrophus sp. PtaU1.Bin208]|nr:MAG: hypothetical protein A4E72_01920 [Syntrophus sp. PtaU1.Bin208]